MSGIFIPKVGTDRKSSIAAALREVADDLRLNNLDQRSAEDVAGRILLEAIETGAFSDSRWIGFVHFFHACLAPATDPDFRNAFCNAVSWIEQHRARVPRLFYWHVPTAAYVENGAPFIADLIELLVEERNKSEAVSQVSKAEPVTESPTLFHSGHDESEGEWSEAHPMSVIAKAIGIKSETAKPALRRTGLIQKTRQRWIVKLDTLSPTWADAINAIRRNRN
jgi:hypothetical protein